jgi:hypothetical protein
MRTLFALVALALAGVANASTLNLQVYKDRPPVTYQAAYPPVLAKQNITFDNTASVQSAAFPYQGVLVRVQCDAICHIEIGGTNPTAVATSTRLTAGQTEYFVVVAGDKLAVIGE